MKMRKISALLLTGSILIGLAGCGAQEPPAQTSETHDPSDVKIGILIPGSPTDGGFCQLAAEAGETVADTKGYSVSIVEAATADTIKQEAETMAAEGYAIVIGHGGQASAPLAEISGDYPDTWFITTGGTEIRDNQFPICLCLEEATYVAGVIAAMMTKTDTIAYSLGGDYPAYRKTTNGFELGAKSVNPDITVMGAVLSATSSNEAYETTMNQIRAGADVIYSNTNEGQAGALKAVTENPDVYAFGHLGNFIPVAPQQVIGNVTGDWKSAFLQIVEQVMNQEIEKAETFYLTMDNHCVAYEWNEDLRKTLPEEVVTKADEVIQDIMSGKIHVPNEYELG